MSYLVYLIPIYNSKNGKIIHSTYFLYSYIIQGENCVGVGSDYCIALVYSIHTQLKGSIQSQNMAPPITFLTIKTLFHFHYFISFETLILVVLLIMG